MRTEQYVTRGGLNVHRTSRTCRSRAPSSRYRRARRASRRAAGLELTSTRRTPTLGTWGSSIPPLELTSRGAAVRVSALTTAAPPRGFPPGPSPPRSPPCEVTWTERTDPPWPGEIAPPTQAVRRGGPGASKPRSFTILRAMIDLFASSEDAHLGLYGAFGYDLAFQFEPIRLRLEPVRRPARSRALRARRAHHRRPTGASGPSDGRYDFEHAGVSTAGYRVAQRARYAGAATAPRAGSRAGRIRPRRPARARAFKCGDLSRSFPGKPSSSRARVPPSELFRRLRERKPRALRLPLQPGRRRVHACRYVPPTDRTPDRRSLAATIRATAARSTLGHICQTSD